LDFRDTGIALVNVAGFFINSRRHHHIEFRSASDAARFAATVVLANESKGFLNETERV